MNLFFIKAKKIRPRIGASLNELLAPIAARSLKLGRKKIELAERRFKTCLTKLDIGSFA